MTPPLLFLMTGGQAPHAAAPERGPALAKRVLVPVLLALALAISLIAVLRHG